MGEEAKKGIGKLKIGLVISVIVILVLATLSVWFYYDKQSLESVYNDYMANHSYTDTEYLALNSAYTDHIAIYNEYVSTHSHTNSEYDSLQSAYNQLQQVVNLQKSQIIADEEMILQEHGERTLVMSFIGDYAGYFTISIESTTSNAYVDVEFYFHGKSFKFSETLGTSGSTIVCVLPATVSIYVGNSNWFDPATHSISVTYWY